MVAINNVLQALQQANAEAIELIDHLYENLQEIREHARRERVNRR
jgi:hypothetical protein